MASNLDIIKRAMKKIHVLASGTAPTSAQATDGMDALQSLIVELIGQGSLGRLNDVLATSAYTAKENDRVQASTGVVVTLPLVITAADCGYGWNPWYAWGQRKPRPPRDRTPVVVITDNVPVYNVYCAYLNEWVVINDLAQQDDFPFAQYLENGFAALLAERIADDYDQAVGPETMKQAAACRSMLSLKMDSSRVPTRTAYY
jgi:hypothetical protein